eukprot:CAMPEP_0181186422 /NCGR_PEP_ID=MMETSP1096-20121128/10024_1 /TAXON_ID=156174 ORGANISM="Chrysochromulina ericina, Strain CCMP281" /NCGR_SAMPLE_ID=MMETSP1096 /ASSEMBLY_ACC=CAM_ASM_000453 /LENGTH=57 /DNA_ID=CAMNT_0023275315 /DNA_START=397 /DNA_END=570 /DNA_ORIENTATION=+
MTRPHPACSCTPSRQDHNQDKEQGTCRARKSRQQILGLHKQHQEQVSAGRTTSSKWS